MNERQLALLWRAQRLDSARLRTTDGREVEVVYRGRPHRTPGPDFRGAILVVGRELCRGDVELHLRSSAWTGHKHHHDHRYDRVVLHVVLQADPGYEARTASGALVPCLPLDGALPDAEAMTGADAESECRKRVAELSDLELGRRLDALGDLRFADRADTLGAEAEVVGFEQALYARLLDALGYSQNREPARELAGLLTIERLYALAHRRQAPEAALICRALLFGVAGLLPSQRQLASELDWPSEQEADELESVWRAYRDEWEGEALSADSWSLGVRPLNSPPRRLAGLAEILGRHLSSGLFADMIRALGPPVRADVPRSVPPAAVARALKESTRRLVELFVVDAPDSYWARYHDFGRLVSGEAAPRLVGTERAREVAASVGLPLALAWADATGENMVAEGARAAFAALPPLALNEATRWMVDEVIGPERRRLVRSARRQQGLYYLNRIACDQRLCDRCPLLG